MILGKKEDEIMKKVSIFLLIFLGCYISFGQSCNTITSFLPSICSTVYAAEESTLPDESSLEEASNEELSNIKPSDLNIGQNIVFSILFLSIFLICRIFVREGYRIISDARNGVLRQNIKIHRNKMVYCIIAFFGISVILAILIYALKTPEQDAQDKLYSKAQSILKERQKEQQEQDAELQKKYDEQAQYEEWIDWQEKQKNAELQKKYDDQAKYEKWIAQKKTTRAKKADAELQKKYDDQAKYEEWIAWQQQNTPEKRIRDSLSDKDASVNVSNQGNDSYQVSITTKAKMRSQFEYITMSEHEKNTAMIYDQCRHIVKDIQDSEVPVSLVTIYLTGKTQDSEGYINDNDNIAICGVKGNADCKDVYSFQNYVTRLWMVNGL